MGDDCENAVRSLDEARQYVGEVASRPYYCEPRANAASGFGLSSGQVSRRIRPKGEEARHAIGIVLRALECDVSVAALERAVATVKAHLEADA